MTEHDDWARDYILDAAPVQIASAMIALADEVQQASDEAPSIEAGRAVERSQAWARLAALVNATGEVEWKSSQTMFTLARRAAGLKAELKARQ
jgi:hypothetical protein